MVQRPFLEELARGIEGEEQLIAYLKTCGFTIEEWVEDEAKITGKGPTYQGYIKPDLRVSRDGKQYWIDSKRKDAPVFYGITREWRHGIDGRCYWNYQQVQNSTKIPVWIAFIEPYHIKYTTSYSKRVRCDLNTGGVLFIALDAMPVRQDFATDNYDHMIYWNRADMRRDLP